MDFSENYAKLLKDMKVDFEKKYLQHIITANSALFPFKLNRDLVIFNNGFYNVFGEFSRILLEKKLKDDFSPDKIIKDVINKDMEIEEGTEEILIKLFKEYMFNEKNELKLLHPHLYLYIPLSPDRHERGEKELALFLRDIFCSDNEDLVNLFKSNESNHIITNSILNSIPSYLEEFKTERKYSSKLNYINQLFNEDIDFAIKNKKFFLDNMDNLFAYYYFFYISQLIFKISKRLDCDDNVEELYYLLDWESVSKNRKTLNQGYGNLKEECHETLYKVNLIFQLNSLLGTEYYLENELLEFFEKLDSESQQNFLYYLKKWITDYRTIRNFKKIDLPDDYNQLVDILLKDTLSDKKKGVSDGIKTLDLFTKNLEAIAKRYFLKLRGSYSYVLNMNRDMLLMITALCVKDKKIKLNQLFKEYEKRGIFFDKYSKEEVVNFLTKLNLIDKKSDSGDAQYVKPIL